MESELPASRRSAQPYRTEAMPLDFAPPRKEQSIDDVGAAFHQHMHMVRILQTIPHHEIAGASQDTTLWRSYAERLAWAMKCQGLIPGYHQSELARRVGNNCKPQNIQYLLNPRSNARASKYTACIAAALHCDSDWLATGVGPHPVRTGSQDRRSQAASVFRRPPAQGDNYHLIAQATWPLSMHGKPQRTFVARVEGTSMDAGNGISPSFPAGCRILIDTIGVAKPGCYVLAASEGHASSFRQLLLINGRPVLLALNPRWPERYRPFAGSTQVHGIVRQAVLDL